LENQFAHGFHRSFQELLPLAMDIGLGKLHPAGPHSRISALRIMLPQQETISTLQISVPRGHVFGLGPCPFSGSFLSLWKQYVVFTFMQLSIC
jgi:hypothetical protein